METDENTPVETPANTPTSEIDDLPPKPSVWPMAIGVIAIVFGSLGLLCGGVGPVVTIAQQHAQGLYLFFIAFQGCASLGLSLWLLIAGIGVVRRRAWARAHLIGWSLSKIAMILLGLVAAVLFVNQVIDPVNAQLEEAQMELRFTATMALIMAVIGGVFASIWPLFVLIWLARSSVKEEVAAWKAETRVMI